MLVFVVDVEGDIFISSRSDRTFIFSRCEDYKEQNKHFLGKVTVTKCHVIITHNISIIQFCS